jgi:hypothetical protein
MAHIKQTVGEIEMAGKQARLLAPEVLRPEGGPR